MKNKMLKTVILGSIICISAFLHAEVNLVSPPNGMTMSHFAASFKANSTSGGPYHFEISKDPSFSSGVITRSTDVKAPDTENIYFYRENGFELTAGTWYWRVAENNKAQWSPVWTVYVETSMPTIEPLREISPDKPYFHARLRSNICTKPDALQRVKNLIPDDLKENLILDHPTTWPHFLEGMTVIEYYEKVNSLGYPFTMDLGRPDGIIHENQGDRATTLSEAEYVLKNFKNCILFFILTWTVINPAFAVVTVGLVADGCDYDDFLDSYIDKRNAAFALNKVFLISWIKTLIFRITLSKD